MAKYVHQNQGSKTMERQNVIKKFEEMGARVKIRAPRERNPFIGRTFRLNMLGERLRRNTPPEHRFTVDVSEDKKGEFFDIVVTDKVDIDIVNIDAKDRHLLLNAKIPRENPHEKADMVKALCGHDERHWFSSQVNASATNINTAKDSLKPAEIIDAQKRSGVKRKNWNKRKNDGFVRQGEWFFVPTDHKDPEDIILKNEPLILAGRVGGKPHIAQYAYRFGGEVVYVATDPWGHSDLTESERDKLRTGYTEEERKKLYKKYPKKKKLSWTPMVKDPTLYVKGTIRHPDHATITLKRWHKVVVNGEIRGANVVFLD